MTLAAICTSSVKRGTKEFPENNKNPENVGKTDCSRGAYARKIKNDIKQCPRIFELLSWVDARL